MIKLLVDSASDVEKDEADELGIELIPIKVCFGDEEYSDGFDLSHREFFEKLIESGIYPQTSQINEFGWEEKFGELTRDGSEVIAITLSSKLSGTYVCAASAAKKFGGKVYVVDSVNACIGERILLQYAIKLVKENKLTAKEIVKELDDKKTKIQLIAVMDTLKYLRKGGRISSVAAFAGEMMSIKPVIAVVKGEIKVLGKAIGSKRGNNRLNQLIEQCGGIDFDMPYALGYSGLSDEYLQKYLKDSEHLWKGKTDSLPSYLVGSTIGTHVGPNVVAVAFFAK
ncbi:MAG: DegV family protein [Clostridiales bacterium]|nr:DegV family protein [Clostridiales bacterium]